MEGKKNMEEHEKTWKRQKEGNGRGLSTYADQSLCYETDANGFPSHYIHSLFNYKTINKPTLHVNK